MTRDFTCGVANYYWNQVHFGKVLPFWTNAVNLLNYMYYHYSLIKKGTAFSPFQQL